MAESLAMDEGETSELIEDHSEELTMEEQKELQTQQHGKVLPEIGDAEEAKEVNGQMRSWECWECVRNFQTFFKINTQKRLTLGVRRRYVMTFT